MLAECEPLARILFAGLWCHADRAGRLEDRPKKLKAVILPYDDCDLSGLLDQLASNGFINRYERDGADYIQILSFNKHQNPHVKEPDSTIPAPYKNSASTRQELDKNSSETALTLNPITLTLNPVTDNGTASVPGLDVDAWNAWVEYRKAIRKPLKPVSIPAAQKALAAYGSVQMAVVQQSVANGWQGLFGLKDGAIQRNKSSGRKTFEDYTKDSDQPPLRVINGDSERVE